MREIVKPTLKAAIAALILTVGVGFVLAGMSPLLGQLFSAVCKSTESLFCRIVEKWYVYWWFAYAVLWWPLLVAFLLLLIRKLVVKGKRSAAIGLALMTFATLALLGGLANVIFETEFGSTGAWRVWFLIDLTLLILGVKLYLSRADA